jgi:hypothetical protein
MLASTPDRDLGCSPKQCGRYPNYNPSFSEDIWINGDIGSNGATITSTPYLNKAALVDPPAYTVGNIARSAPFGLFAPHNADVSVSVRREFSLHERVRLAFQADAFDHRLKAVALVTG